MGKFSVSELRELWASHQRRPEPAPARVAAPHRGAGQLEVGGDVKSVLSALDVNPEELGEEVRRAYKRPE